MRLTLCPLFSGSSGNSIYISAGGVRLLVDAGMSAAREEAALREIGVDVRDLDGVRWINDSKATNVASAYYALQSMTTPTVLILGGKDKGNDYSEILDLVRQKVKHIVAMGLHNEKIVDFFGGIVPVDDTHTLADAVAACRAAARPGDTVLLSPCCASFDLFTSYEDRGRRFKDAVHALK